MALSLKDVNKSTKKPIPKRMAKTKEAKSTVKASPRATNERLRPWQSSEDVRPSEPISHSPKATNDKKSTPPPSSLAQSMITDIIHSALEDSWVSKVQLHPKVRIPIPKIFSTRE